MDSYAKSGVNLQLAHRVKASLPSLLRRATRPEVLGKIGAFGGLFRARFRNYREPILVASMDGVGTKLRVAIEMRQHNTVGHDLVNHCCNDITVMGAEPLFFLDYLGMGKLQKRVFEEVVSGFADGCAKAGVALLGGETAQMPGFYAKGDYDLAGTMVGVVDRPRILDGSRVRVGDVVIGLASTGLHTNGYSLAREILFKRLKLKLTSCLPELGGVPLGKILLEVHRNYYPLLARLQRKSLSLHAAAHITGGGFEENIPRVLPRHCAVEIWRGTWAIPPIFTFLQRGGQILENEMYRVFNMGIGMVLIVPQVATRHVRAEASRMKIAAFEIGRVIRGKSAGRLKLE